MGPVGFPRDGSQYFNNFGIGTGWELKSTGAGRSGNHKNRPVFISNSRNKRYQSQLLFLVLHDKVHSHFLLKSDLQAYNTLTTSKKCLNGIGMGAGFILSGIRMGSGVILQEWDGMGFIFLLWPGIGTGWDSFSGSGMGWE